MTVGQDAGRDDPGPSYESDAPVRRIDEDRWEASWGRFQAAHDDNDAALSGPLTEDGVGPAPQSPPDVAIPPAPTIVPIGRAATRHQREEEDLSVPEAPTPPPVVPVPDGPPVAAPRAAGAFELTSQTLLRPNSPAPERGWRRALHAASRGTMNPGPSPQQRRRADIMGRLATPVQGSHRIAVISLKGGVGKTTVSAGLSLTLAQHRGDRVVALDANPDAGTLAERVTGDVQVSVRDLLADVDRIRSFTDVAAYTSLTRRLQVVAADPVPDPTAPFDELGYRTVTGVLSRFFNIIVTDSGAGVLHSAMAGTLALADSLVVVGGPNVDGASRAAKTLDWVADNGFSQLAERSVAVISSIRPDSGGVDLAVLRNHLSSRVRALVEVPYDRHFATGGLIVMDELREPTRAAFMELAAVVAEGFVCTS